MKRIQQAFDKAHAENRAAFVGYVSAGFPDVSGCLATADALLERADILEIGLPYSDPLGDGPTIQRANEKALAGGMTVAGTFEVAKRLRERSEKPMLLMTYYNPILATGEERFLAQMADAGLDGLILPDLPPDEADTLIPLAKQAGIGLTFLIAPTSTEERLKLVAQHSTGFIYAVSVTGVTGARAGLPDEVPDMIRRIKQFTTTPVVVGFGISNFQTANFVANAADGVVVASVFINALEQGKPIAPIIEDIYAGCARG